MGRARSEAFTLHQIGLGTVPSLVKLHSAAFCPGLEKGTVLLEGKGHFRARNHIFRALLRAELHFEATFVRRIVIKENKAEKNYNFTGSIWLVTTFSDKIEFQL